MKTLLIVGSVALWMGYIFATTLIIALGGHRQSGPGVVLLTIGSTFVVTVTALIVGQLVANVADPATAAGRRHYRQLAVVYLVTVAIAAALTIIGGIVRAAPAWEVLAIIALSIACSLAPIAAAARYRRALAPRHEPADDLPFDRRRIFRRMGLTWAITAAILGVGLALLHGARDDGATPVIDIVALAIGAGAVSGAVPAFATSWRSTASINRIFGTDIDSRKLVSKVVIRGRSLELSDAQKAMAARFARTMREVMPIQSAQALLIIFSAVTIQAPRIIRGELGSFFSITYAAMGVLLVVAAVFAVIQFRSVRRYAEAHPVEVTPSVAAAT